jgi:hypothetical protein
MKYLLLLAGVVVAYVILTRQTPVAEVKTAVAQTEVAPLVSGSRDVQPASALKRPINRTHAVLDQVKQRNGAGEF